MECENCSLLKKQLEEALEEIRKLKVRNKNLANSLDSYQKEARRRYYYESDYLPYEHDDRD